MNHLPNNLSASLWGFQQEGWFCDAILVARDGVEMPVHAAVLAAASSHLQVELRDKWSPCSGSLYKLDMSDYDENTLKAILKYIYTGDLYVLTHCSMSLRSSAYEICSRIGVTFDFTNQQMTNDNWNMIANGVSQTDASFEDDKPSTINLECSSKAKLPCSSRSTVGDCSGDSVSHDELLLNRCLVESIVNLSEEQSSSPFSVAVGQTNLYEATYNTPIPKFSKCTFFAPQLDDHATIVDGEKLPKKSVKNIEAVHSEPLLNIPLRRSRQNRRKGKCSRRLKSKSPPIRCHVCAQTFSCKKLFTKHIRIHEKLETKEVAEASKCEYELFERKEPKLEQLNETDVNYSFNENDENCSKQSIEPIATKSSVERNFVCDVCNRAFILASHLRRHKARHDRMDSPHLSCTLCDKRFFNQTQLLKHKIAHTGVWPAQCNSCKLGFLSESKLAEHAGVAHGAAQPHACEFCGRRFALGETLDRHSRVHDKGSSRRLSKCSTCGKTFRCAAYLRSHQVVHAGGARPFVCDVCGKGFLGSSSLTTHRRIHTGERPYACTTCNKRFLQLCAVREHEKIHIGLKLFVCHICGKQFMTYAQLYNHSRIHGGVKSFECEVCKKTFYTNGDLAKHARIHGDRRPFVCDVCGKAFKYSSNLHGHARIHTGVRPYVCSTCGKGFTYSSHLSRHAKLHIRDRVLALNDSDPDVGNVTTYVTQADLNGTVIFSSQQPPSISHAVLLDNLNLPPNISTGFPILAAFPEHACH